MYSFSIVGIENLYIQTSLTVALSLFRVREGGGGPIYKSEVDIIQRNKNAVASTQSHARVLILPAGHKRVQVLSHLDLRGTHKTANIGIDEPTKLAKPNLNDRITPKVNFFIN